MSHLPWKPTWRPCEACTSQGIWLDVVWSGPSLRSFRKSVSYQLLMRFVLNALKLLSSDRLPLTPSWLGIWGRGSPCSCHRQRRGLLGSNRTKGTGMQTRGGRRISLRPACCTCTLVHARLQKIREDLIGRSHSYYAYARTQVTWRVRGIRIELIQVACFQ